MGTGMGKTGACLFSSSWLTELGGVSCVCPHACMCVNECIGVSALLWISEITFPSASDQFQIFTLPLSCSGSLWHEADSLGPPPFPASLWPLGYLLTAVYIGGSAQALRHRQSGHF